MARLDVILDKSYYSPGEKVKGRVFVGTSKKIECQKLNVIIEGEVKSTGYTMEYVTKSKKSKKMHTQLYTFLRDGMSITKNVAFDPGTHKFEFSFIIPSHAKVSYEGKNGHIRYTATAIMNVSRITKVTGSKGIKIYKPVSEILDDISDEKIKEVAEHEGENILEIEIDTQRYCIGENIPLRYLVNTDMKFNEFRAEIEHIEITHIPDKMDVSHKEIVWRQRVNSEDIIRNDWQTWILKIDKELPALVRDKFIVSGLNLKVIIGRSFRFDKTAEIALAAGYCPKITDSSEMDADVPKGIPKPTRVRCKKCSYTFKLKEDDIDFATCPSCGKQIFL